MASTLTVQVNDQNGNPLVNIGVELHSYNSGTGVDTKMHSNTLLTASNGRATFTSNDPDLLKIYPTFYIQLYEGSQIIKATGTYITGDVINTVQTLTLFKTSTGNNTFQIYVEDELSRLAAAGVDIKILSGGTGEITLNSSTITTDTNGNANYVVSDQFFVERNPKVILEFRVNSELRHTSDLRDSVDFFGKRVEFTIISSATGHVVNRVVCGTILSADETPLAGKTVKAYHIETGNRGLIDSVVTGTDGGYYILYNQIQIAGAEQEFDLQVDVVDTDGTTVLIKSPIILNSNLEETINLIVSENEYTGPDHFSTIDTVLTDGTADLDLTVISDSDIALLSRRYNIASSDIRRWIAVKDLNDRTGISADVIHALLINSSGTSFADIVLQGKEQIISSIMSAHTTNQIKLTGTPETAAELAAAAVINYVTTTLTTNSTVIPDYKQLLDLKNISAANGKIFLTNLLSHEGDEASFWELLATAPISFSTTLIDQFKDITTFTAISSGSLGLTKKLLTDFSSKGLLFDKTVTQWETYLESNDLAIPSDFVGETDTEKRHAWAQHLSESLESYYPTAHLTRKISTDSEIIINYLDEFIGLNPAFDFATSSLLDDPAANYNFPTGSSGFNTDSFIETLKSVKRVYSLMPSKGKAPYFKLLWNNNLHSAISVSSKGENRLTVLATAAGLDANITADIYRASERVALQSIASYLHFTRDLKDVSDLGVADSSNTNALMSNFFGSQDYCQCEHCQSVYGPAAYLMDLINFCENHNSVADSSSATSKFMAFLKERRPDIPELLLNCKNTNQAIPYLDIVNEVLERKITPAVLQQTENDPEDIETYPQSLIAKVYDEILPDKAFPWQLPFHLWNEEADAYLNMVDTTREQIALQIPKSITSTINFIGDQELKAALCFLKIAPKLYEKLTGTPTLLELYKLTTNNISELQTSLTISVGGTISTVARVSLLKLLQKTGLSYQEFLQYLKSRFINPTGKTIDFKLSLADGSTTEYIKSCKLEDAGIDFNSEDLIRLYKFVQLHRVTGWQIFELDRVFKAFDIQTSAGITNDLLTNLYYIQKIHQNYKADITGMLTWWRTMDMTENYEDIKSLYAATYGAKVDNENIVYTSASFTSVPVKNRIAAVNELSGDEYSLLLSKVLPTVLDNSVNSITNYLTILYGVSYLSRIIRITIPEYIQIAEIMEMHPVTIYTSNTGIPRTPKETSAFLDDLETIRKSGFTIPDFIYLMSTNRINDSRIMPKERDLIKLLTELRTELKEIRSRYILPASEPDQNQWNAISQIFEVEAGNIVMLIAENPTGNQGKITEITNLIQSSTYLFPSDTATEAINRLTLPNHADFLSSESDRISYFLSLFNQHVNPGDISSIYQQATTLVTTRLIEITNSIVSNTESDFSDSISAPIQQFQTNHPAVFANVQNLKQAYLAVDPALDTYLGEIFTDQAFINTSGGGITSTSTTEVVPESLIETLNVLLNLLVEKESAGVLLSNILTVYSAAISQNELQQRRNLIVQCLGDFIDAEDLCNRVVPNNGGLLLLTITARVLYTVEQLINYLMRDALYQKLSNASDLEYNLVKLLFDKYMNNYGQPLTRPAQYYFTYHGFVNSKNDILFNSIQSIFLEVFYKCAAYIKVNKLSLDDVDYILNRIVAENSPWIRFTHFPARYASFFEKPLYSDWVNLQKNTRLHRALFRPDYSVFELYQSGTNLDKLNYLRKATEWTEEETACMNGLPESEMEDDHWVSTLENIVTMSRKTKISYNQLKLIVESSPNNIINISETNARMIRYAAKASFSNSAWLEQAVPVRNVLREKQRDAMVAYICLNELISGIITPDQLFEYLFIDTQMASCGRISRIKEATLAVQTMINRALLGLLPDTMTFSQDNIEQWDWRRNYRVWEANRKVFLYPENYLLPELRSDKTPLYKDFEKKLKQSDLSEESVSQLYRDYLTGLADVANLEVCAFSGHNLLIDSQQHNFGVDTSPNDMHVLAHSRTYPRKYYYRKWVNKSYWTAWEPMDIDIKGDHIGIAQWNQYVVVTWLEFNEVAEEPIITTPSTIDGKGTKSTQTTTSTSEDLKPSKYQEIRLNWCIRSAEKWGKQQFCNEPLIWLDYRDGFKTKLTTNSILPDKTSYSMSINAFLNETRVHWSSLEVFVKYNKQNELPDVSHPYPIINIGLFKFNSIFDQPVIDSQQYGGYSIAQIGCTQDSESFAHHKFLFPRIQSEIGATYLSIPVGLKFSTYDNTYDYHSMAGLLGRVVKEKNNARKDFWVRMPSGQIGYKFASYTDNSNTPHDCKHSGYYGQDPLFIIDDHASYMTYIDTSNSKTTTKPSRFLNLIAGNLPNGLSNTPKDYQQVDISEEKSYFTLRDTDLVCSRSSSSTLTTVEAPNNSTAATQNGYTPPPLVIAADKFILISFSHQLADTILREVNKKGINAIVAATTNSALYRQGYKKITNPKDSPFTQESSSATEYDYYINYNITINNHIKDINKRLPRVEIEFDNSSPYGTYNWELFYHLPMMIAERLTANGSYAEARKWYHAIFNPTIEPGGEGPERFWMLKPFYELLKEMGSGTTIGDEFGQYYGLMQFSTQIDNWERNPFDPHAVARLRIVAYMKYVYMKYLDNLIAWADSLYARDTWETIQESLQLYILAVGLLGRRPEQTRKHESAVRSVEEFSETVQDAFSNILVKINNVISGTTTSGNNQGNQLKKPFLKMATINSLYFGIPHNEKILVYWDILADRLFKIRHCMNIEGVERQLALFDPPIDPMLLVRAKASGLSIGAALSEINTLLPSYRFQHLLQKAVEFAGEVKSLGQSMLSALEKKDAEQLSLLRNTHEASLYESMRELKVAAINEAQAQLEATKIAATSTLKRSQYYQQLLSQGLIDEEKEQLTFMDASFVMRIGAAGLSLVGSLVSTSLPDLTLGFHGWGGSPVTTSTHGGKAIGAGWSQVASQLNTLASLSDSLASRSGIMAGHKRREQDWKLQNELTAIELKQTDKQILAATIRLEMAQHELNNLDMQINQNKEIEAYLEDKFSSAEMYGWMLTRLSDVYLSAYKLALEMARKAERAYRFELAESDTTFIGTSYWDSLYKGLLAGESLTYDLHRMDAAFTDKNSRRFEMQKHISLATINPTMLINLRATGKCEFDLHEMMFDLDYPGQYQRRIKSISISIPAVTGPYTNVNCKLTLVSSSYRKNALLTNNVYPQTGPEDSRFVSAVSAIQSIATSNGMKDSGMFEFNFNDARYLPFEGAGAISKWTVELPAQIRQFDYDTISDVIIHVNYTALEDGQLKNAAAEYLKAELNQIMGPEGHFHRMISLKQERVDNLYQFLNPQSGGASLTSLVITHDDFPYFMRNMDVRISSVSLYVQKAISSGGITINSQIPSVPPSWVLLVTPDDTPAWSHIETDTNISLDASDEEITIAIGSDSDFSDVDDVIVVLKYSI